VLPFLVDAVRAGKFAWIDGGRHLTSSCHVRNVCTGMMLAAERGRGGEIYFLTDGEPVEVRRFLTELLEAVGVRPGARSVPRFVARAVAWVSEAVWRLFRLRGAPPIDRTAVRLIGEEVTVDDSKARRELGYAPIVSREVGLAELRATAS
jgi:nucleoside-diphosphate-sugar epimerase